MAPKKKEVQKLSLGEFLNEPSFGGSWADEVEDTYASGTQPLPPAERRGPSTYGGGSSFADRGYSSLRDNISPAQLPTRPPFTAHLGNLSYNATAESVTEFFEGCDVVNVRIIEDRETQRPKGFAYAEFKDVEGLKTALTRDGETFDGRSIRIKIADPPKQGYSDRGESSRDLPTWERRGPLPDLPGRDRPQRDFGERRAPREFAPADDGKVRDFGNWERRGPLPPAEPTEQIRDSSRSRPLEARGESFRSDRRASPAAWGPGEGRQDTSRPPRREFGDRPERAPTAAEKDNQWRNSMRPATESREGSVPNSPAPSTALPVGRPKLNLAKRTVSEAPEAGSTASTDSKASPFGAARPIDTAAREREIEEKRLQALKEKKEADEKAKEEKRLAKEAAAKAEAEKAEADAAAAKAEAEKPVEAPAPAAEEEVKSPGAAPATPANGVAADQKLPVKAREPREAPKTRATESGNWRSAPREPRGGAAPGGPRRNDRVPADRASRAPRSDSGRGPRANGGAPASQPAQATPAAGAEQAPATPAAAEEDDGWTKVTVPSKNRRGTNRAY